MELGQDPDGDFQHLLPNEASDEIKELIAMTKELG